MFKSGTELYNRDLDNEADTVAFYNCSTLGYDATYNIPNTDTSLTVSTMLDLHKPQPSASLPIGPHSIHVAGYSSGLSVHVGLHA